MTRLTRTLSPSRHRDEHGQSTIEWLGVCAVVVAVIAAIILVVPGMGGEVTDAWKCLVSKVTGEGNACGTTGALGEPERACTTSQTTGELSAGGRIAVVDLEGSKGVLIRETSDGKVHVTFIDTGSLGASVRAGGGAEIQLSDAISVGLEGKLSAGGDVGVEVGETRVFDNPENAEDYIIDQAINEGIDALPPGVDFVTGKAKDLGSWIIGHDPPQGEEESQHGQIDIGIDGKAEGTAGIVQAEVEASVRAGARVTVRPDGSRTIRMVASAEVAGSLGIPIADIGANGKGTVQLELDLAPDGSPQTARVRVIADGTLDLSADPSIDNPTDALKKVGTSLTDGDGTRTVVTAELDVSDPDLADAAGDLVGNSVDVATGDGEVRDVEAAGQALLDELAENGNISIESYDLDTLEAGVEAEANLVIGVGGKFGISGSQATLRDAIYFDPETGQFVEWESCTGGGN